MSHVESVSPSGPAGPISKGLGRSDIDGRRLLLGGRAVKVMTPSRSSLLADNAAAPGAGVRFASLDDAPQANSSASSDT